jgi:hypothetical protein
VVVSSGVGTSNETDERCERNAANF